MIPFSSERYLGEHNVTDWGLLEAWGKNGITFHLHVPKDKAMKIDN